MSSSRTIDHSDNNGSSSDDSDDEEFLKSLKKGSSFSTTNDGTKKRNSSRIASSGITAVQDRAEQQRLKRKMEMKQMVFQSLQRSEKKKRQEERIDEIHQNDKHKDDDDVDDNANANDGAGTAGEHSTTTNVATQNGAQGVKTARQNNANGDNNSVELDLDQQAAALMIHLNVRESRFLASRPTLFVSATTTTTTAKSGLFLYMNIERTRKDLRLILRHQYALSQTEFQKNSTNVSKAVLQFCERTWPRTGTAASTVSLLQTWAALDADIMTEIPWSARLLQWLFVLACSPPPPPPPQVVAVQANDTTNTDDQPHQEDPKLVLQAQKAAYQVLVTLWSSESPFSSPPSSSLSSSSGPILTLPALSGQLRQWYGLRLPAAVASFDGANSVGQPSRKYQCPSDKTETVANHRRQDKFSMDTCPNVCTRQFLHLWSIALRKNLVLWPKNEKECMAFAAAAILSVLWAGLDPSLFLATGFCGRADDDPSTLIHDIVGSILTRLRKKAPNSYDLWTRQLSDKLVATWTQCLGRGRRGTDAHEDLHAWMCLSATLRGLGGTMNTFSKDVALNNGSAVQIFQLQIAQSIVCEVFPIKLNSGLKEILSHEDVLQKSVGVFDCRNPSCQALALSALALANLNSLFPAEEPPNFLAVAEVALFCFLQGIHGIYPEMLALMDQLADDDEECPLQLKLKRFYQILEHIEGSCQGIAGQSRNLVMQSVCFPRGSQEVESIRGYIRLCKERFAPYSAVPTPKNRQQSKLSSFFSSAEII